MAEQKKRTHSKEKHPQRSQHSRSRSKTPPPNKTQTKARRPRMAFLITGGILCLLVLVYIGVSLFFTRHYLLHTEINGEDVYKRQTLSFPAMPVDIFICFLFTCEPLLCFI